ncbi:MAG: hemolysin family protein [Planctomycetota bacterium]
MFILLHLPIMAALLALSALFSGSETALFSLRGPVQEQMRGSTNRLERLAGYLLDHRRELLITILLGNMIVNILFYSMSVLVSLELYRLGHRTLAPLAALAGLACVVVCGEVSPKAIAVHFPRRIALLAAWPIYLIYVGLTPIRGVLGKIVDAITHLAWRRRVLLEHLTDEELRGVLDLGHRQGVLRADQMSMMAEVMDLADTEVREIMTARVEVPLFDIEGVREELVALIRRERCKFVLAYRSYRDNSLGILRAKEALLFPEKPLSELVRKVPYVPETRPLDALLRELREGKQSVAIVIDEHGGTEGVITVERLVERIVGTIRHEYERSEEDAVQLSPDSWSLAGRLPARDLEDVLRAPVEEGDFSTLAGLVLYLLGRVPETGDQVRLGDFRLTVTRMSGRRIERVVAERLPRSADGEEPE